MAPTTHRRRPTPSLRSRRFPLRLGGVTERPCVPRGSVSAGLPAAARASLYLGARCIHFGRFFRHLFEQDLRRGGVLVDPL